MKWNPSPLFLCCGVQVHRNHACVLFICEEHTDVNDPLLDGWLACMPVIPEAKLHFWGLVILKHGHHHGLEWRRRHKRKKSRGLRTFFFRTNAANSHQVSFITPNPTCHQLFAVSGCVFACVLPPIYLTKRRAVIYVLKPHHATHPPDPFLFFLSRVWWDKRSWAALWPH